MPRTLSFRALLAALAVGLTAGVAPAEESQDCPKWFPDFRCERSGRWDDFHKPIVQPFLFEDPFITTNLSQYYIYHEFPRTSILQDGHLHSIALQARVAITDRLAFVATKDGVVWNRPETQVLDTNILDNTSGFWNISGGFKYALLQDRERGYIVSPIIRFEVPTGSHDSFQGRGFGLFIPSVAGAWRYEKLALTGDMGAQISMGDRQSDSLFWHLHGSYTVLEKLAPFLQISGIAWVDGGDGEYQVRLSNEAGGGRVDIDTAQNDVLGVGDFEGADVANIGTKGIAGKSLWTIAAGIHIPITKNLTFSAAYERPFTNHKGIFKQRMTSNVTLEF